MQDRVERQSTHVVNRMKESASGGGRNIRVECKHQTSYETCGISNVPVGNQRVVQSEKARYTRWTLEKPPISETLTLPVVLEKARPSCDTKKKQKFSRKWQTDARAGRGVAPSRRDRSSGNRARWSSNAPLAEVSIATPTRSGATGVT